MKTMLRAACNSMVQAAPQGVDDDTGGCNSVAQAALGNEDDDERGSDSAA